jgi:hypothetical protein
LLARAMAGLRKSGEGGCCCLPTSQQN